MGKHKGKLIKVGNSLYAPVPKPIADGMELEKGDTMTIEDRNNDVIEYRRAIGNKK